MKLGIQNYFVYVVVLKWLELVTIVICLKLRAKFPFQGFFLRFWHFLAQIGSNLICLAQNLAHNTIWYILLCLKG